MCIYTTEVLEVARSEVRLYGRSISLHSSMNEMVHGLAKGCPTLMHVDLQHRS